MTTITITKPASVGAYAAHRIVADITGGAPAQFVDNGTTLTVRTDAPVPTGTLMGFTLRASCGVKVKGLHRYFAQGDHAARKGWLERKGALHGFEVVACHVTSKSVAIERKGRKFTMDQSDFTGVLKVTDAKALVAALQNGIGGAGKAFGFGMLVV
jgi:CRISPR-associated protein Cas6/Cse3/CasE subtype I-E